MVSHGGTADQCSPNAVSQNLSFMRPVAGGDVRVVARVLKPGRNLFFGEVELIGVGDGKLAAHATTTYAML